MIKRRAETARVNVRSRISKRAAHGRPDPPCPGDSRFSPGLLDQDAARHIYHLGTVGGPFARAVPVMVVELRRLLEISGSGSNMPRNSHNASISPIGLILRASAPRYSAVTWASVKIVFVARTLSMRPGQYSPPPCWLPIFMICVAVTGGVVSVDPASNPTV